MDTASGRAAQRNATQRDSHLQGLNGKIPFHAIANSPIHNAS